LFSVQPFERTMTRMLRRGAPLTPRATLALAALAPAGLATVVACVSNPHASRGVMLFWHGSIVLMLMAVAAGLGASMLTWASRRRVG
jgi:Negative regulator of sigma F